MQLPLATIACFQYVIALFAVSLTTAFVVGQPPSIIRNPFGVRDKVAVSPSEYLLQDESPRCSCLQLIIIL